MRKATIEDAPEIANVHTYTWLEAYKDLMPESFLAERPMQFKHRIGLWDKVVSNPDLYTFVAENDQHGIIGFVSGGKGRDANYSSYAEIYCIYLFSHYHKKGIGYGLLDQFFKNCKSYDYTQAYLWVLKNNPTIDFYQRANAKFSGETKKESLGEIFIEEDLYLWNSLELPLSSQNLEK